MKIKPILVTLAGLTIILASCTQKTSPTPSAAVTPGAGLPNPASEMCIQYGATVEIRDTEAGQAGYCIFPDGTECEEWAFFNGECKPQSTPEAGVPNPASQFCVQHGGQSVIRDTDAGQVGTCVFPDGSECEEWAFFNGECMPSNVTPMAPAGSDYAPIDDATCSTFEVEMNAVLGVISLRGQGPFIDSIANKSGAACQILATGNGAMWPDEGVLAESLSGLLTDQGWSEDLQYAAGGPTGLASGYRKGTSLCLLKQEWQPSPDANCPPDQPISSCTLAPAQKLYTITLSCAVAVN